MTSVQVKGHHCGRICHRDLVQQCCQEDGRPTLDHETEILKHEIREHEIRELVSHGATLVQNFRGGVGLMVAVDILGGICCHLGFP